MIRHRRLPSTTRPPLKIRPEAPYEVAKRAAPASAYSFPTPPPHVVPPGASLMAQDDALANNYVWANAGVLQEGLGFLGFPYLAELTQRPEYRLCSEIIAREMTRKWIKITATGPEKGEKVKQLEEALDRYKVRDAFRRLAELDGFFGRAHLYLDTGKTDDPAELATPLITDVSKIGKRNAKTGNGGLRAVKVVEPIWSYPNRYNSSDPLADDYYIPQQWWVQGREVHKSRFLTLVSRPVPDLLKPAYSFGGLSLSQMLKPYVDNWLRTMTSVSDLVHNFSIAVLKTDMSQVLAGGGMASLVARAELFNRTRDNRGVAMLDMEAEDLIKVDTSLAGLDDLQAQALELLAAISGIPPVVLLGVTPAGLNASSDGEIRTFYMGVKSRQELLFTDPLRRVFDVIQISEFGSIDTGIGFQFIDLWETDESENATNRQADATTDGIYIDKGVLSPEDVRLRLSQQEESPYYGLDMAGIPEAPPGLEGDDEPDDGDT